MTRYEIRPLGHWTDKPTETRRSSSTFRASWTDTLNLLQRETEHLSADRIIIQIDVLAAEIRLDGMLRANARVGHPGVVISFTADIGPLRYATDVYDTWKANVRAITLGLAALRAVDRYGITTRHEQYHGWAALPAGVSANGFTDAGEALTWMRQQADRTGLEPEALYRHLARRFHPDSGADQTKWHQLDEAWRLINAAGLGS